MKSRTWILGLVLVVASALIPSPATAFCIQATGGNNVRWAGSTLIPRKASTVPTGWDSTVNNARIDWNGIAGSTWSYSTPSRTVTTSSAYVISNVDFSANGWQNVPGYTILTISGSQITKARQYQNTDYSWNFSGTMVSGSQADVHTVVMHEMGHILGLLHPLYCGTMTAAEQAAAMNPDWTKKWDTNSDDEAGAATLY